MVDHTGEINKPGCGGMLEITLLSVSGLPKASQWDKQQEVVVTFYISPGYDEQLGTGFIKSKVGKSTSRLGTYTWGDSGQKLAIPYYCPAMPLKKTEGLAGSHPPELIVTIDDHNHIVKADSFLAKTCIPFNTELRESIGEAQKCLQQKQWPNVSPSDRDLLTVVLQDANRRTLGKEAKLHIRVAFIPTTPPVSRQAAHQMMQRPGCFRVHVLGVNGIDNRRSAPNKQNLFVTVKRNWKSFGETEKDKRTTLVKNAGEAAAFDQVGMPIHLLPVDNVSCAWFLCFSRSISSTARRMLSTLPRQWRRVAQEECRCKWFITTSEPPPPCHTKTKGLTTVPCCFLLSVRICC
jgi:hypothetical protein